MTEAMALARKASGSVLGFAPGWLGRLARVVAGRLAALATGKHGPPDNENQNPTGGQRL